MTPVKWLEKQAKIKHVTLNEAEQILPAENHFAEIARRYEAMEKALIKANTALRHISYGNISGDFAWAANAVDSALAAARAPLDEEKP